MNQPVIAIDATELQGKPTGVGRYLHTLLTNWSKCPEELSFLLYHSESLTWSIPEDERFRMVEVRRGLLSAGWYQQQRMIASQLNRDKPDILFAPAYTLPLAWRGKTVLAVHDLSFQAYPQWYSRLHGFRMRWLCRKSCKKAQTIIADTQFGKDEIVSRYQVSENKVEVIPLAIERNAEFQEMSGKEKLYVLVLGSIFERRFPLVILDAWKELKNESIELVFVGDDRRINGNSFQEEIDRRDLSSTVQWMRYVGDDRLPGIIAGASAMLYLSQYEGFGLPPLEAMSMGVPAIVSARGALKEVYGANAILIDEEKPSVVAEAVRRLLTDTTVWERYSKLGMELANNLTPEKLGQRTLEVLLNHV